MSQSSYVKSGFPQDVSAKKRRDLEYVPKNKELLQEKVWKMLVLAKVQKHADAS